MTKDNYFKPVEFDGFKVNSQISNPDFNYGEFAIIKIQHSLNQIAIHQMRILLNDRIVGRLDK